MTNIERGLVVGGLLAWFATAWAVTPTIKCEQAKLKAAGKKAQCLAMERAKEVSGRLPNYAKCTTYFSIAFTRAEAKAGLGICPTNGDDAAIEARIDSAHAGVAQALDGIRFVDNLDGTITDTQTGLMWEKKTSLDGTQNFADPHDADNFYLWTSSSSDPDGPAFTKFLGALNACESPDGNSPTGGFAGHCDWRLPTSAELQTIVDLTVPGCASTAPCIGSVFVPTQASLYWSGTTRQTLPAGAWTVGFADGTLLSIGKVGPAYVRAVRAGL